MRKLTIEVKKIDDIKPYGNNVKKHPAEQIEQIKKSIIEFGFNDPIAIYEDGEIAEGHGRYIAAVDLGMVEVPTICLTGLSEDEQKAYRLVHNHLTTSTGFDIDVLNEELGNLHGIDMQSFGFLDVDMTDDFGDMFTDSEQKKKEPKQMQCPYCGEWFEV